MPTDIPNRNFIPSVIYNPLLNDYFSLVCTYLYMQFECLTEELAFVMSPSLIELKLQNSERDMLRSMLPSFCNYFAK